MKLFKFAAGFITLSILFMFSVSYLSETGIFDGNATLWSALLLLPALLVTVFMLMSWSFDIKNKQNDLYNDLMGLIIKRNAKIHKQVDPLDTIMMKRGELDFLSPWLNIDKIKSKVLEDASYLEPHKTKATIYTGYYILLKETNNPDKPFEFLSIFNPDKDEDYSEPEWDLALPIPTPDTALEFQGW